jgi:hypothetical protein
MLDLGLGERIQIGDDFRPGAGAAERGDAILQCLLRHQGEEAAEHVRWERDEEIVKLITDLFYKEARCGQAAAEYNLEKGRPH